MALSIPLLILLVEQARASAVISTSVGQVLVSSTRAIFITILSLGSVVTIGASMLYFETDSVLLVNFGLSSICITFILWGYCQALSLLLSPSRLRAKSQQLLEQRLAESMSRAFQLKWMDRELASKLSDWNPASFRPDDLENGDWSVVRATVKGRVTDVAHDELAATMRRIPVSTVRASQVQLSEKAKPGVRRTQLYVRSFGEHVLPGDPILAVNVDVDQAVLDDLVSQFTVEPTDA